MEARCFTVENYTCNEKKPMTTNKCKRCGEPALIKFCSLSCGSKYRAVENAERYYKTKPKRCKHCSEVIPYEKRNTNVYCSRSCAATVNNKTPKRQKKIKEKIDYKQLRHLRLLEAFESNTLVARHSIRKVLIETQGNKCSICDLPGVWEGKPITLTVDHEDGDAGNNSPSNLRLLCPNCNSQTPTFCGRNKGKGRGSRGLPGN